MKHDFMQVHPWNQWECHLHMQELRRTPSRSITCSQLCTGIYQFYRIKYRIILRRKRLNFIAKINDFTWKKHLKGCGNWKRSYNTSLIQERKHRDINISKQTLKERYCIFKQSANFSNTSKSFRSPSFKHIVLLASY